MNISLQLQQIVVVFVHGHGYGIYAGTEVHGDLWGGGVNR